MGNFIFNGVSAADMGLVVERYPGQPVPRKRLTSITIPGRSGNLHQWDGAYENVTLRYRCWFKASPVTDHAHAIKAWLMSAPALARLEDTYDPQVFRLATYKGGAEIDNVLDRFGRFTIEFDCDAPVYLKSGETGFSFNSDGQLINPTSFASAPLIRIHKVSDFGGVVRIGDYSLNVLFNSIRSEWLYVDCALREAWEIVDGIEVPSNANVSSPSFPVIEPGVNDVSFSGVSIDRIVVTPRWWSL